MAHHLMLLPSLACPGRCIYCFGPHEGYGAMERPTLEAILRHALCTHGALDARPRGPSRTRYQNRHLLTGPSG